MNTIENAPPLELDKTLYLNHPVPPHVRRERRIVWNLMKHLYSQGGWNVVKVYDGDEYTLTIDAKAALEVIFNRDAVQVGFKNSVKGKTHYVKLVLGNDMDVISDWNYTQGDPDGFDAAMDKFDPDVFA